MIMADSVYKNWDEKIGELTSGDFKEGVLKAIRQLKEEVYNLKVDNFNLTSASSSPPPKSSSAM